MAVETLEDQIDELTHYVWESMDMNQIEEYIKQDLHEYYTKNPDQFIIQWQNYKEVIE